MKPTRIVYILCPVLSFAIACGAPQTVETAPSPAPAKEAVAQDSPLVAAEPGPFAECKSDILACAIFATDIIPDIEDRHEALDLLIKAYAKVGLIEKALDKAEAIDFDELKSYELEEDEPVDGVFLSITYIMSMSDDCDKILEVREKIQGQEEKTAALRHAVECFALIGNIDRAAEVLEMIEDKEVKDYTRASMALGLAKAGKFDAAAKAFDTVEDKDNCSIFIKKIGELAVKAGALDKALALAEKMDTWNKNTTFLDIIDAYEEAGKMDEAHKLGLSIKDPYYKTMALVYLALGYIKIKDIKQALKLLDQAKKLSNKIKKYESQETALMVISEGYYKAGEYEKSKKLCLALEGSYTMSSCLESLVSWLVFKKQVKTALKTLDAHAKKEWSQPYSQSALAIGRAAAESGQADTMLKKAKTIKDPLTLEYFLIGLAEGYIKAGKLDEVTGLVDYAKDNEMKCKLYDSFAAKFSGAGEYDRAFEAVKRMKALEKSLTKNPESCGSSQTSDMVMFFMAQNYAEKGEYDKAIKARTEMEDPSYKSMVVREIALGYAKNGEYEGALTFLLENEKPEDLRFSLGDLFNFYAAGKQLDKALLVALAGPDESYRAERVLSFAKLLGKRGTMTMYGWKLEAEDVKVKDKKVGKLIIDSLKAEK